MKKPPFYPFWAMLMKIGLLLILTSGHTGQKGTVKDGRNEEKEID